MGRETTGCALPAADQHYRALFEAATVPIWELDLTLLEALAAHLKVEGRGNGRARLCANPQIVAEAASLVEVLDVNPASLQVFGAHSKAELIGPIGKVMLPETASVIVDLLLALSGGERRLDVEVPMRTLGNGRLMVRVIIALPPAGEALDRVFCRVVDITGRKQAEAALRESEARLRLSTEAAGIGTFSIDVEAGVAHYSPELAAMLGFPQVSVVKLEDAFARVHRDDVSRIHREYQQVLDPQGDGQLRMELRFVRPGGEVRWMTWSGRVEFRDAPGDRAAHRILGACVDVTERKRVEETLREREAQFRQLVNMTSDWFWEQDEKLRFVEFSARFAERSGLTRNSHIGRTRWEVPSIGVSDEAWARHRAQLERREPFRDFDVGRIDERGQQVWISISGDPIFDAAGRFRGYRGTSRNITTRRRVREALRHSEARFRALAEEMPHLVWETDADGEAIYQNARWHAYTGLTTAATANGGWLAVMHPQDGPRLAEAWRRAVSEHAEYDDEARVREAATGGYRWYRVKGVPIRDATGQVQRWVGTCTDIDDQKRAEAALRQSEARLSQINAELEARVAARTAELERELRWREAAQATLEQAQRLEAVGRLAGGLAHDFNNTLAAVAANLELAQMRVTDGKALRHISLALDAIQVSVGLNRRLLTITRRGKVSPGPVQIGAQVGAVVGLLERTRGQDITVTTELAPDLWPVRLDAGELDSAILNLAINACDAMPDGGRLTISGRNMTLVAEAGPHAAGAYVRLSVSDTGTGMKPEVLARAADPFFSTKDPSRSTGLGLSSVKELVEASGGFIAIDSTVGLGTTVSLHLPRASIDVPGTDDTSGAARELPLGDGELVLLIDDDQRVLEATQALLEGLGYAVLAADSGAAGIAFLQAGEPVDVVLSDILMPGGMSGFDVVRQLRARWPGVAAVLFSGFEGEQARDQDPAIDGVRVMRKPFTRAQLAAALRDTISASASRHSLRTVPAKT